MKLEYLVTKAESIKRCMELETHTSIFSSKSELEGNTCIVSFSTRHNDEVSAKRLSEVNDEVCKIEEVVCLTNESSEYFNNVLYPFLNTFERKMRKLLYIASSMKPEVEGANTITNLESRTFNDLFRLLFLDIEYQNRVKAFVRGGNNPQWEGYSEDIKTFLAEEKENSLWDRILTDRVPTLRASFLDVRKHRNDVMHAHNISKDDYKTIKNLFIRINEELDKAIEELIGGAFITETYNQEIEDALSSSELLNTAYTEGYLKRKRINQKENLLKLSNPENYEYYKTTVASAEKKIVTIRNLINRIDSIEGIEQEQKEEMRLRMELLLAKEMESLLELNKEELLDDLLNE